MPVTPATTTAAQAGRNEHAAGMTSEAEATPSDNEEDAEVSPSADEEGAGDEDHPPPMGFKSWDEFLSCLMKASSDWSGYETTKKI